MALTTWHVVEPAADAAGEITGVCDRLGRRRHDLFGMFVERGLPATRRLLPPFLTTRRSDATLTAMPGQPAPPLSPEDQRAAQHFLAAARGHFGDRLVRIVLYGSKARGDAHSESDLDLLVILRGPGSVDWRDARAASFLAADVGLETGVDVAAKCMSSERFDREAAEAVGFATRVSREGITLWPVS
jgi:predicted nucleotidyltransferase